jgi:signal transduction histidine kinase
LLEELKTVNREMQSWMLQMSHDVRTPMNAIMGAIELLLIDVEAKVRCRSREEELTRCRCV